MKHLPPRATGALARLVVAVAATVGAMSAHALSFVATSPTFVGTAPPPASQAVGSFSFSAGQLALVSPANISSFTVSGVWGGGAYQDGTGTYETAPSDLYLGGIKIATCGPFAECSSGYSPIYEGIETWSYTFTSGQYAGLLSALGSGPLVLTSVLDSPYSQNYANDLSSLQLSVSTGAVAAVPEPTTSAFLVLGLGLVGGVVRARAKRGS